MNKMVFVDFVDNYNIEQVQTSIEKAFEGLNLHKIFKPKMKVLIKPSLSKAVSADMAQTTHPSVVRAVVNILTDLGVTCILADCPYGKFNITNLDETYLSTGMLEVANLTKCELNHNLQTSKISCENGVQTKDVTLLKIVEEVDAVVNIGKVKIDNNLGYIGSTANLFGLIPGEMKNLYLNRMNDLKSFDNFLLDVSNVLKGKLVLNVLDGIVAQEAGDTQRILSCLAVAENSLSLDAAVLDILGVDLTKTIIKQAADRDMVDLSNTYKDVGRNLDRFKIQDFALINFDGNTQLHKNKTKQKQYFNHCQRRLKIDCNKCKGCGICAKICPTGAIEMKLDKNNELYAAIDYSKCIFCNKCYTACPYKVVEIVIPAGFKRISKEISKYNDN